MKLRIRVTSLPTPASIVVASSILAIWVQRILAMKPVVVLNNLRTLLAGRYFLLASSLVLTFHPSSYHVDLNMDTVVTSVRNLFQLVTGARPRFRTQGGTVAENLALQNIQVCLHDVPSVNFF